MTPFDQEREPWAFEFDSETLDWPWPTWPTIFSNAFYEPCPCCDLGTAIFGNDIPFTCPACAGSGIGGEHGC